MARKPAIWFVSREKAALKVTVVEPSDKLAEGIWKIYNETPIRQERAFTHYGESLETVNCNMYAAKNNTFIGAYLEGGTCGFHPNTLWRQHCYNFKHSCSADSIGINP